MSSDLLFNNNWSISATAAAYNNKTKSCHFCLKEKEKKNATAKEPSLLIYFITPNNFSRRTHVDRSCIICGIFRVSFVQNYQSAF